MTNAAKQPNPSIARLAGILRTLPLHEAREFMAGLLPVMQDIEEVQPLRAAFVALNQCDAQLELLAPIQTRLSL